MQQLSLSKSYRLRNGLTLLSCINTCRISLIVHIKDKPFTTSFHCSLRHRSLSFQTESETMELDLTPKLPKQVYGGDGGSYFAWCPEELPMLKEGNIGAAKLALEQYGFAVPRYSDSPKVAYVLQGQAAFSFCPILQFQCNTSD